MMSRFRLQEGVCSENLQPGLKCAHVLKAMWASSVSLAHLDSDIYPPMVGLLPPAFPVTATTMQTSVILRLVAASAKTTLLETSVNAVLRVIMVMPFMVPTMIVSHVLAPTEVPVSSYLMIQLCVWSALRDMQVLAVSSVRTVSSGTPRDVMGPLGHVNVVIAMATLIQMLWPIVIGQLVNVSSVSTTLEDFTVTNVYQASLEMLWHYQREIVVHVDATHMAQ